MTSEGNRPSAVRDADRAGAWDVEADVVVVGLGCAGACAAIEAAEAGGDVLVLERAGGGGRGILVTSEGQRFINEDAYYGRVGQECLFRHDGRMYLIVDDDVYERNLAGFEATHVEESIADLERSLGMASGALQGTVAL